MAPRKVYFYYFYFYSVKNVKMKTYRTRREAADLHSWPPRLQRDPGAGGQDHLHQAQHSGWVRRSTMPTNCLAISDIKNFTIPLYFRVWHYHISILKLFYQRNSAKKHNCMTLPNPTLSVTLIPPPVLFTIHSGWVRQSTKPGNCLAISDI